MTALLRTRGSWVRILPGAPKIKDLAAKTRSSRLLWDLCGTSYPPVPAAASDSCTWRAKPDPPGRRWTPTVRLRVTVGDAQHRLRAASIEYEVGLLEQMADVGTGVMTRHRMIGVAKKRLAILGGYAGCTQATRERVAKVMNANQGQAGLVTAPAASRCCSSVPCVCRDTGTPRWDACLAAT